MDFDIESSDPALHPATKERTFETPTDKSSSSSDATPSTDTDGPALYLPVTTESPDVLGMREVSGFYGPGSWAGWFLSIAASWSRLLRASEERFDPNTWTYLLGTNWAAVGLFRGIRLAQSIPRDSLTYEADLNKLQGSLGAAFNVTFWGTFHASIQYLLTMMLFDTTKSRRYRLWTLLIGLTLPSLALLRSAAPMRSMNVPALYWRGMDSGVLEYNLTVAAATPYFILPFSLLLVDYSSLSMLPSAITNWVYRACYLLLTSRMIAKVLRGLAFVWLIMMLVSGVMIHFTENEDWMFVLLPLAPLYIYMMFVVAPLFWMIFIGVESAWYIVEAYLTRRAKASQSCFFMPCAPQSVNEEDQLFALFVGLLLFFGWEVIPNVAKEFRKRYRDRQEFVEDMEERMRSLELRRTLQRSFGWETSDIRRIWSREN
jgi:hypothetical protein